MPICANKFNHNKCGHFPQFIIICVPYSGVLVILQVPRIISPFWEQLCRVPLENKRLLVRRITWEGNWVYIEVYGFATILQLGAFRASQQRKAVLLNRIFHWSPIWSKIICCASFGYGI